MESDLTEDNDLVDCEELMSVLATDKVEVEPGDAVCIRTGFDRMVL
ncbi:MAG: hypothetical protein ACLQJR_21445 [Stellaceae bacterium]